MQEAATGQSRARFFHNIPLAALILGAIFAAIGLILTIGGIWLAVVGGSLYYVLAGLGLLASAWFLLRGNRLGTWIYAAVYAATVVWALWESGANPWALIPRLVGPTVLLALLLLFAPLLDRHRTSWRNAGLGAAGALGLLAVILIGAAALQPGGPRSPFPEELRMAAGNDAVGADWPAWGGTQAGQRAGQVLAHLVLLVAVEEHHVLPLEQPGIGVGRDLAQVAHLHVDTVRARHVGQQTELARGHVGGGDEQHRGRLRRPPRQKRQ